jgi:hypothetical protein
MINKDVNVLEKYNYGTGAGWCKNRDNKKTRGSQEPGKTKGEACHASAVDRFMAKTERSYKHRDYPAWSKKVRENCKR